MDVIDFAKRVWQNRPSVATPIDAAALNRLEDAVDSVVDRLNDPDAMASQDKDDYASLTGADFTGPVTVSGIPIGSYGGYDGGDLGSGAPTSPGYDGGTL